MRLPMPAPMPQFRNSATFFLPIKTLHSDHYRIIVLLRASRQRLALRSSKRHLHIVLEIYTYKSHIPLMQLAKAKASERPSNFGDNHVLSFYCSDLVLAGQGGGSCSDQTGTLVGDFKVDANSIYKGGLKL